MTSSYFAHPTAIVDDGATIGADSKIWHFVHVSSGATIGERCIFGQNVFVGGRVTIGNGVKVQNNVSIYDGVVLEDEVFCGPSMVFTNVYNPRAGVEKKSEFRTTLVRKGATIGANATIICGAEVGRYSLIGAGTVVREDVADYALVVGNPGRHIGWVDQHGDRLPFKPGETGEYTCERTGIIYTLDEDGVSASA